MHDPAPTATISRDEHASAPGAPQSHSLRTPALLIVATVPATIRGFLLPMIRHFRAAGWRVDAMAAGISECADCVSACDRVWEVAWSRNPLDVKNLLGAPRAVRQVLAQKHFDIVHVHTPVAALVTRFALRKLRRRQNLKIVYTAHGFHFHPHGSRWKNALFARLEQFGGRWTDQLVVINREDAEAARTYRIVADDHICEMPGIGVDLKQYGADAVSPPQIEALRRELGLSPADALFTCVAEFIPRKRQRYVLRALAALDRDDVHLALAGDGPLVARMKRLAKRLGIRNRVHFLGFRRDVPCLIRASTATILASQQEGLLRAVMESMALGTPVIGASIRGTQELLEDGAGLLFEVGDVAALAAAMARLLDSPDEAAAVRDQALERISAYDVRRIIQLHERLYAVTIDGKFD